MCFELDTPNDNREDTPYLSYKRNISETIPQTFGYHADIFNGTIFKIFGFFF